MNNTLEKLTFWTREMQQRSQEPRHPYGDAALKYDAKKWRKWFEAALKKGLIERSGHID